MIKYCDNKEHIVPLWKEAFGDTDEEILWFIDNVKDAKCLMYYADGEPASMMYLVSCSADGEKLYYIFAACTSDKYRGRGYMSKLIDYCIDSKIQVCLIPASDSLIDYYSKRKINKRIDINSIKFEQTKEIEEFLFEGYSLSSPTALRS